MTSFSYSDHQRQKISKQVTVVGAVVNVFLGIIKVVFGLIGHSSALVADGIHSLADLVCDALVWIAAHFSHQAADHNHPYGHRRFETIATFILGVILVGVGLGIAFDAIVHIMRHEHQRPDTYTAWVALISVLFNESLFRYQMGYAKKLFSDLLRANAWHSRGDALSSLIVLVGLLGAIAGWYFLDAIAAMVVGLFIIKIGIEWGWRALNELSDEAVDEDTVAELRQAIAETPGVVQLHQLRTRRMADKILIDVHIQTLPYISVSEGHYIAELVRHRLKQKFSRVQDVVAHVDVDDDQHLHETMTDMPLDRDALLAKLLPRWHEIILPKEIYFVIFHYFETGLEAHVVLYCSVLDRVNMQVKELTGILQKAALPEVQRVKLLFVES